MLLFLFYVLQICIFTAKSFQEVNIYAIGDRIRELRTKLRLSQTELGNRVDTDGSVIFRWETNKARVSQRYIVKLANALDTSTDYLLGETDDPKPITGNTSTSESVLTGEATPYTQEQINKGILVYTLSNAERIELPPIKASYDFL